MTQWPTRRLDEVARRIGGGTPPREDGSFWGGDIPWFTVADLSDVDDIQLLSTSREAITHRGVTHSAAKMIPAGAVVFSSRVVVGKVGISTNELATNQDFSSFVPTGSLNAEFLAYFLIKVKYDLRVEQRGATIKGVTTRVLDSLQVPIPPVCDQARVVRSIRECMARVDKIEALHFERSELQAKLLRAARRDLLGDPYGIPTGWTERRLDELAGVIYGISEAISSNRDPAIGPPIIRMANISKDGHLDLSDLRYCKIPSGKEEHFLLRQGDLLLNWRSGSSDHVGKTAIFRAEGAFTCASFILRIRAKDDRANNRYLRHVLNFLRAEGVFSGSARMQINHKLNAAEFSAFPIRVPPTILEQERIADQLDAAESVISKVDSERDGQHEEVTEVRAAILRKAFAGEL